MTISTSVALRNLMLSGDSFKATMDGGQICIYGGTVPASADATLTGATLLCTIMAAAAGINMDTAAASGTLAKATGETWSGTNEAFGATPILATFYRHISATEWAAYAGSVSTTTASTGTTNPRMQGTIGIAGADMNMTNPTLVESAGQNLNFYTVTLPE